MKRLALAFIAFLYCVPVRTGTIGACPADSSPGLRSHAPSAGSNEPNRADRKPINLGRTSLAAVDASSVSGERGIDNVWYGALNAFDDGHNRLDRRQTYWRTAQEDRAWLELHFDAPVTVTSIEVDGDTAYHAEFTREDGGEESRGVVPGQAEYQAAVERVRRVRVTFDKEGANLEIEEVRVMGHPPAGAQFTVDKPRLLVTPRTSGLGASDRFNEWYMGLWKNASRRFEEDGLRSIVTYTLGDTDVYRVIYSKADGQAIEETLADFTSLPRPRPIVEPPPIQLLPLSSVEKDAGDPTSFRFLEKELGGALIERVGTVDLGLDVGSLLKVDYGGAPGDRRGCFGLFAGNRTAGYWPVLLEQCHERSFRGDIREYSCYVNDVDGDGRLEILPFEGRGEDAILETVYVFDPVTKVFGGAGWGGLSRENFENRRARGRFDATIGTRTSSLEERAKAPIKP